MTKNATTGTADLSDQHSDIEIAAPIFRSYGGVEAFSGAIATIRCFEDNSMVRTTLDSEGAGRVLVVDGGGSLNCALLGDILADKAVQNKWAGVLVYGCVRDTAALRTMQLGVRALAAHPLKSVKRGVGDTDIEVSFAGVTFIPGHYLYADTDGIIVSPKPLSL